MLLVSAIFRLQFGAARGGTTEVFATWTREEGEAMKRAMTRIDTPLRSDTRTVGQRESDRFVAVARHVLDYLAELTQARKPAV